MSQDKKVPSKKKLNRVLDSVTRANRQNIGQANFKPMNRGKSMNKSKTSIGGSSGSMGFSKIKRDK